MAGHNKMKMTDLARLFKDKGFRDPETFIQSGNVIFKDSEERSVNEITTLIESSILERFGLDVPALVRSIPDLKKIISANPFLSVPHFDPARMAVMFLYEEPSEKGLEQMKNVDYPPDKFSINGREIYIWCPNGFGRTKLYTNFFEGRMKVIGTARNWNTVNTILELAQMKNSDKRA